MANEFKNGVSSETVKAGRIVAHGIITDLSEGFQLTGNVPFSIMIVPIANVTNGVISTPNNIGIMVSCKLVQDIDASDIPVMFNQWTEGLISSLDVDAIDLNVYKVYWGTGN